MYIIGQCVKGLIGFVDGGVPLYDRPSLIIDVNIDDQMALVLNVSSTYKKEHKLLFDSNLLINDYNPPLTESSFVKLDSSQWVSFYELSKYMLMDNGRVLSKIEISKIKKELKLYEAKIEVHK
jgi:hypothetical protein